jgi:hypothetical protein
VLEITSATNRGRRSNIESIVWVEDRDGRTKMRAGKDVTAGHDLGLRSDGTPRGPRGRDITEAQAETIPTRYSMSA